MPTYEFRCRTCDDTFDVRSRELGRLRLAARTRPQPVHGQARQDRRQGEQRLEKVFMLGDGASLPWVENFASERALMQAFLDWVEAYDPDVFIGWNVVNFDMWFLQRVADKLGIKLKLGRGRREIVQRQRYGTVLEPRHTVSIFTEIEIVHGSPQ